MNTCEAERMRQDRKATLAWYYERHGGVDWRDVQMTQEPIAPKATGVIFESKPTQQETK